MSDLPPELQPESQEQYERRRRRMWIGFGVPTAIAALIAVLLGLPWWLVVGFCALVAGMVIFEL